MNNSTIQGKWTEFKGEIQNLWGKLTHDDLEKTKGNVEAIGGLVQQHYGESKEEVSRKLNELSERVGHTIADKSEQAKEAVRNFGNDVNSSQRRY